jgi:hypothetical protein
MFWLGVGVESSVKGRRWMWLVAAISVIVSAIAG